MADSKEQRRNQRSRASENPAYPDPIHTHTFTGKAFDKNGDLFYVENHDVTYEGERVVKSLTTYYDSGDRIIGTLPSEYEADPRFCTYTFKDFRAGYEDGARMEKSLICLFRKPISEKRTESDSLKKTQNQIVGQGFHHFITNQLEAIKNGEIFHVMLVFPSRLDEYAFRILKLKEEDERLFVRLEIDNWFLRLFAPHLDAVYDPKSGYLLRYEGVSNILNSGYKHKAGQPDQCLTFIHPQQSLEGCNTKKLPCRFLDFRLPTSGLRIMGCFWGGCRVR